jgi:hypothetical protein
MLLLAALGVPQRTRLAALEAQLEELEASLERRNEVEPIVASVDVRICSAIPRLERSFEHCKQDVLKESGVGWLRCFQETTEKQAMDHAAQTAKELCEKSQPRENGQPAACCSDPKTECPDAPKKDLGDMLKAAFDFGSKEENMKSTAKQRNDLMMSKLQGIMLLSEDAAATNEQVMSKEAKLKDDTKLYTAFRMMEGTFQPDTSGFFKKVLAGVLGGGKTTKAGDAGGTGRTGFQLASATAACVYGVAKAFSPKDVPDGEDHERTTSDALSRAPPIGVTERLLARAERVMSQQVGSSVELERRMESLREFLDDEAVVSLERMRNSGSDPGFLCGGLLATVMQTIAASLGWMETDEWRVTAQIDHITLFLEELSVILEKTSPSPALEEALKQTLCTVTLFKNYFKYTGANVNSDLSLAENGRATIDPFGDTDGDKVYLPVIRLSRIQWTWMKGTHGKEYSTGTNTDTSEMVDAMLEELELTTRTLDHAMQMLLLDLTAETTRTAQTAQVAITSATAAEKKKRDDANKKKDEKLKERATAILQRVTNERKDLLDRAFTSSTTYKGTPDPCFPTLPFKDTQSAESAGCTFVEGDWNSLGLSLLPTFKYRNDPTDTAGVASTPSGVRGDEASSPPGSVLVKNSLKLLNKIDDECAERNTELDKILTGTTHHCGEVQGMLDKWWENVQTMMCRTDEGSTHKPCLFDGALELNAMSAYALADQEVAKPGFVKSAARFMSAPVRFLFPGAPQTEEIANPEYKISVHTEDCTGKAESGRWMTQCVPTSGAANGIKRQNAMTEKAMDAVVASLPSTRICEALADKAISALWKKVKGRRCDPIGEYLDEIEEVVKEAEFKEAEEDAHVEEEDARQEAKVTVNFVMDKKHRSIAEI